MHDEKRNRGKSNVIARNRKKGALKAPFSDRDYNSSAAQNLGFGKVSPTRCGVGVRVTMGALTVTGALAIGSL
jgi:hypothetical protein